MANAGWAQRWAGGLIVSCQPLAGSAMDSDDIVVAMAMAAQAGGASALRIEGVARVRQVVAQVSVPVVGIVKRDLADSAVRITPLLDDVDALCAAGAAVVAVDATQRQRPVPVAALLQRIKDGHCLAMADCSSLADGLAARDLGFDWVGTTLSGYTADTLCADDSPPDWALIRQLSQQGCWVVAEGRLRTPAHATQALREGARAVTVGSAITRVEHITSWFVQALSPSVPDAGT
jgi:N-acylglucosamine-6-phosphate 2-epimerase